MALQNSKGIDNVMETWYDGYIRQSETICRRMVWPIQLLR
jgi:hypothetical protein